MVQGHAKLISWLAQASACRKDDHTAFLSARGLELLSTYSVLMSSYPNTR